MSKLLIVDDEIDIREFAKNFFRKRHIDVFTASGGNEALEIIKTESPDLVLLDVRMEDFTGVELLRKLRQEQNQSKVIMVSGVEDEETVSEAKSLGVLGFIHKPLILDELEKIVLKELQPPTA
ncbi:MAG: response regulator [Candidatus Omnitrophota bacterium]|nr:response regulator [Candidatus Omnitrophota bacterium]